MGRTRVIRRSLPWRTLENYTNSPMQGRSIQDSGSPSRLPIAAAFAALLVSLPGFVDADQEQPGIEVATAPTATPAYRQANTVAVLSIRDEISQVTLRSLDHARVPRR